MRKKIFGGRESTSDMSHELYACLLLRRSYVLSGHTQAKTSRKYAVLILCRPQLLLFLLLPTREVVMGGQPSGALVDQFFWKRSAFLTTAQTRFVIVFWRRFWDLCA